MNRIFLITPGRSGTYWVSALMLAATNLPLTGNPEFFPYDKKAADSARQEFVNQLWGDLPKEYLCTSLLPRQGYLDPLREKGARFIHLKRNIAQNAYSMYRMHFAPGRGFRGKMYHPDPESSENIMRLRAPANLSDYQLCLWGCLETRAVAQRHKYLGADMFEFDINEINEPKKSKLLVELLDWVGVEYNLEHANIMIGKKVNTLQRYANKLLPEIESEVRRKDEEELLSKIKELQETTFNLAEQFSAELGVT